MATRRTEETALIALLVFGAVSAIAGGIALITGGIDLPVGWLEGTIFSSYDVPGAMLAVVVGGSQLVAVVAASRRGEVFLTAAALSGGVLIGWIIGEILLVGSHDAVMFGYQLVYFVIGFLEFSIASTALRREISNR